MANETVSKRKSVTEHIGSNIIARNKAFKILIEKAFVACDTSKSGNISKTELYIAMLSVHITLARYAGPAACFPPTREVSDQLFEASDANKEGSINKEEFTNILMILGAQIVSRMFVYYAILILFVPWMSRYAIDFADYGDHIPKGSYLEIAATQTLSTAMFMLGLPLIWNTIDTKTENKIHRMNSSSSGIGDDKNKDD